MGAFIDDLKYMCSASNTKSRGFYLMVVAVLILLPIAAIAGIVAEVIYVMASNFQPMPLVIAVLAIGVEIALIIWLKKS